jgi:hypothetical protein
MNATIAAPLRRSEKIQGYHRDRSAVVYVRQSTLQQIERHQESTRLQYGLVERALELGWARSQVQVIDDDLGKSGSTAEGRLGFQRLVSEVSLNQVGIVLGIEMSRLARSCRDWYQLLEVGGLFGTLIGDLDGIYDPSDYNDRLLLGLKGRRRSYTCSSNACWRVNGPKPSGASWVCRCLWAISGAPRAR